MRDPLAATPIRYKLPITFLVLCLAVLLAGGYLVSRFAHSSLETEIARRLAANADAQAQVLSANRELLGRRAQDFASDGLIRELLAAHGAGDASAAPRLDVHLAQNKVPLEPAFVDCAVWDLEGRLVACAADSVDRAHRLEVGKALSQDRGSFGPFRHSDSGRGPCFAVVTPLRSLDGRSRIGSLSAWVPLGRLLVMGPAVGDADPRDTRLILRDSEGQELEIPWWFRASTPPEAEFVERGFGLALSIAGETADQDVRADQVFSRSSELVGGGWTARIELDAHEASAPIRALQSRYLGTVLVVLAVGLGALFMSIRFIVAPLRRLADAAGRLARGDLDTRVPVESQDELGELSHAFNEMAQAVELRTVEVERHRDELEAVVGAMRDGLCLLDHEGKIILRNRAAEPLVRLLATSENARPGCGLTDRTCEECLVATGADRNCQVELDGRSYEILVTDLSMGDLIGGRLLVSRDVTERRAMSDREAFHERMAVAGELAGVVAHEINNPLASISMFTQMLADELPPGSSFQEHVDVISRNVETCKQAISDLLDNVRGGVSSVTGLDANELVEDALRFLRPLAQRCEVELLNEPAAAGAEFIGDETRLRQVLVNLILNAIQAQEATGGEVRVVVLRQDEHIRITVSDSGPGIPAEIRDRVFDAFFTTKQARTGTGLGLPTARRIVAAHRGSLELIESPDGGTTFVIDLPVDGLAVDVMLEEEPSW